MSDKRAVIIAIVGLAAAAILALGGFFNVTGVIAPLFGGLAGSPLGLIGLILFLVGGIPLLLLFLPPTRGIGRTILNSIPLPGDYEFIVMAVMAFGGALLAFFGQTLGLTVPGGGGGFLAYLFSGVIVTLALSVGALIIVEVLPGPEPFGFVESLLADKFGIVLLLGLVLIGGLVFAAVFLSLGLPPLFIGVPL